VNIHTCQPLSRKKNIFLNHCPHLMSPLCGLGCSTQPSVTQGVAEPWPPAGPCMVASPRSSVCGGDYDRNSVREHTKDRWRSGPGELVPSPCNGKIQKDLGFWESNLGVFWHMGLKFLPTNKDQMLGFCSPICLIKIYIYSSRQCVPWFDPLIARCLGVKVSSISRLTSLIYYKCL